MVLGGVTSAEGQHSHWRQMLHVLDVSIRSDMIFFLPMEPLKSLPLLTLLELCTELLNKKIVILPASHFSKNNNPTKIVGTKAGASASGATSVAAAGLASVTNFRLPTLEFDGMGRFDYQANYLLTLSQLNQHAATIRTLNFPSDTHITHKHNTKPRAHALVMQISHLLLVFFVVQIPSPITTERSGPQPSPPARNLHRVAVTSLLDLQAARQQTRCAQPVLAVAAA